jgi:GTPase SAR1 family protein
MGKIFSKPSYKILILGKESLEKTYVYHRLTKDKPTHPTPVYNISSIHHKSSIIHLWDVAGIRSLWKHFYEGTKGLIYILDETHVEKDIQQFFYDIYLFQVPILVLVPTDQSMSDTFDWFQTSLHKCCIQPCTDGGIKNGFKWLLKHLG